MALEPIERHVWIEERVLVVESGDEPDRQLAVGHRIDESTAKFIVTERIPHRVDDGARLDPIARDLPQLLQADGKLLRRTALAQLQAAEQLLGEIAADAVAED